MLFNSYSGIKGNSYNVTTKSNSHFRVKSLLEMVQNCGTVAHNIQDTKVSTDRKMKH